MNQGQQSFSNALLSPESQVPAGLTNGMGKGATRRFSVYRNNVIDSLIKALQTGFPVISQLLGEQNFKNIASLFLRQHPPESPVINQYGDIFPTFLEGFEPLEHCPILPIPPDLSLHCAALITQPTVRLYTPQSLRLCHQRP